MSNKSFFTISPKECLEEHNHVLENSIRKLRSSELLAKDKDYGSAISLLIISNEELLKSLMLLLDGLGFEFRKVRGIKGLFKNHKLRYHVSMIFGIVISFAEDFSKLQDYLKSNNITLKQMIIDGKKTVLLLYDYLLSKMEDIHNEINFFSHIDNMRQAGFYSDYPSNTPISEQTYLQYSEKLNKLRSVIITLIDTLKSTEQKNSIEELKSAFKSHGLYDSLEQSIEILQNPRTNSYDGIREKIKNFSNRVDIAKQQYLPRQED